MRQIGRVRVSFANLEDDVYDDIGRAIQRSRRNTCVLTARRNSQAAHQRCLNRPGQRSRCNE